MGRPVSWDDLSRFYLRCALLGVLGRISMYFTVLIYAFRPDRIQELGFDIIYCSVDLIMMRLETMNTRRFYQPLTNTCEIQVITRRHKYLPP